MRVHKVLLPSGWARMGRPLEWASIVPCAPRSIVRPSGATAEWPETAYSSCAPDTATKSRHTGSWRRMKSVKASGLSSVTALKPNGSSLSA